MDADKTLTKLDSVQDYIFLIRKELNTPEPNYIALQNLIDDFVLNVLNESLRAQWLEIQGTLTPPQYVSNKSFRDNFAVFLENNVEPNLIKIPETDKNYPAVMDAALLKDLVNQKAEYLQKISQAEASWKGKWKDIWKKQLEKYRNSVLYGIKQDPEVNVEFNALPDNVQSQYAELVIMAGQEVATAPLSETQPRDEKINIIANRIEQSKLRELGFPDSLAGSKFSSYILSFVSSSGEELKNLPPVSILKPEADAELTAYAAPFALTSAAIDLHPIISQELSKISLSETDKQKLVTILADYHQSIIKYETSTILSLQVALRSKINALNISNLPTDFLNKLFSTKSPYEWVSQIEKQLLLPHGVIAPLSQVGREYALGEKAGTTPQEKTIITRLVPYRVIASHLGGVGTTLSATGNGLLSGMFGLSRMGSLFGLGRSAAGAIGQNVAAKAVTFWGKYYLIILGIAALIFCTGFISFPGNSDIIYKSDSAALIVKNEGPEPSRPPYNGQDNTLPRDRTNLASGTCPIIDPHFILTCVYGACPYAHGSDAYWGTGPKFTFPMPDQYMFPYKDRFGCIDPSCPYYGLVIDVTPNSLKPVDVVVPYVCADKTLINCPDRVITWTVTWWRKTDGMGDAVYLTATANGHKWLIELLHIVYNGKTTFTTEKGNNVVGYLFTLPSIYTIHTHIEFTMDGLPVDPTPLCSDK